MRAVIVRDSKRNTEGKTDHISSFDDNSAVLINQQNEPIGTENLWARCKGIKSKKIYENNILSP